MNYRYRRGDRDNVQDDPATVCCQATVPECGANLLVPFLACSVVCATLCASFALNPILSVVFMCCAHAASRSPSTKQSMAVKSCGIARLLRVVLYANGVHRDFKKYLWIFSVSVILGYAALGIIDVQSRLAIITLAIGGPALSSAAALAAVRGWHYSVLFLSPMWSGILAVVPICAAGFVATAHLCRFLCSVLDESREIRFNRRAAAARGASLRDPTLRDLQQLLGEIARMAQERKTVDPRQEQNIPADNEADEEEDTQENEGQDENVPDRERDAPSAGEDGEEEQTMHDQKCSHCPDCGAPFQPQGEHEPMDVDPPPNNLFMSAKGRDFNNNAAKDCENIS